MLSENLLEYKVLICDDNAIYIHRLREEISAINYRNREYNIIITASASPQMFIEYVKTGGFDVIILDNCIKDNTHDQVLFDYIRSRLYQDYYGADLYEHAKKYCPDALIFVLSNLPVSVSRTEFNNVDAEYFCKAKTNPAEIANYIKNYFDTNKKRIMNNN